MSLLDLYLMNNRKSWAKADDYGRMSGRPWQRIRQAVMLRDRYCCQLCKLVTSPQDTHIDHIVPLSKGGGNELTNLRTLCVPCHEQVTAQQQGKRAKVACGADGFPLNPLHHWNK